MITKLAEQAAYEERMQEIFTRFDPMLRARVEKLWQDADRDCKKLQSHEKTRQRLERFRRELHHLAEEPGC